jgi:hypothetical protein
MHIYIYVYTSGLHVEMAEFTSGLLIGPRHQDLPSGHSDRSLLQQRCDEGDGGRPGYWVASRGSKPVGKPWEIPNQRMEKMMGFGWDL